MHRCVVDDGRAELMMAEAAEACRLQDHLGREELSCLSERRLVSPRFARSRKTRSTAFGQRGGPPVAGGGGSWGCLTEVCPPSPVRCTGQELLRQDSNTGKVETILEVACAQDHLRGVRRGHPPTTAADPAGSAGENLVPVPVEVFTRRWQRACGEQQRLAHSRPTVVLPGQRIGRDGVGEPSGQADAKPAVDGKHAAVERGIVSGAGSQPVAEIEPLARGAVFPGLDVPGQKQPLPAQRRRAEPAGHAPAAAVGQYVPGEHVLPDPGGRQQDPLRFPFRRPEAASGLAGDLVAQLCFEHRQVELGRVTPRQKQAMVKALQARGHTVAMTGDGVNHVLALKLADIGIAIGSGAPATKAVAELVLLDGRFATLPGVVAEGRRVTANIERVASLFITKTVWATLLAVAVGVTLLPYPFLPRHLTIIDTLAIGVPAFFLSLAPNTRRYLPGFARPVLRFALPPACIVAAATFAAYPLARASGLPLGQQRTPATRVARTLSLCRLP